MMKEKCKDFTKLTPQKAYKKLGMKKKKFKYETDKRILKKNI